jgi:hypothetical protein
MFVHRSISTPLKRPVHQWPSRRDGLSVSLNAVPAGAERSGTSA